MLSDQEDAYSIGYIELKSDKSILNSLGLWVKYTITAGENVIQGVDYLNSQYRKVSFKPDTQQNGIIIPQIEELKIPGNTVVDQNKIRIYFMALPDAIKENAENLRIDIQPYYFDLDVTNNKDISNFRLKQNGQIVNNITADITIEDSGLYQSQVFIVDQNDQLVNIEQIVEVSMDLWSPYKSLVEELMPNANITADRFHVMKQVNDELDAMRKSEKRAATSLDNKSERDRILAGLNKSGSTGLSMLNWREQGTLNWEQEECQMLVSSKG
ncbi:hypothetical protein AA650_04010 [Anabaena sp. WA102]|nr:hypothetical protein AA650_04010 [Anabaena sp. WA102]